MAKLNNLAIMVALLSSMVAAASMVALASPVAAAEVEAPSPSQDDVKVTIPPEPEPGFYQFLEECTQKMSRQCGENVVKSLFENVDNSRKCCGELVNGMGKTCHQDLLKFFVSVPELHPMASQIYIKGDQLRKVTVQVGLPIIPKVDERDSLLEQMRAKIAENERKQLNMNLMPKGSNFEVMHS
ncbi:uncharacterized protein LOC111297496 [Durio zibethinus]|uniref:Uncharacterized protein LOC111297496 n=1 Tax=Durio zibethinus TaxID=66656 RepID=A0A6P5Z5T2_DURZI|nr:uncharacterized protein LOC111297496 [Durio zibethinus]